MKPSTQEKYDAILQSALDSWKGGNTGEERKKDVKLILDRIMFEYPKILGRDGEELFLEAEAARDYSSINYYQNANFPELGANVHVFRNADEFRSKYKKREFLCPHCGGISSDPQVCDTNKKVKGKICDWKSYGLFGHLGLGWDVVFSHPFSGKVIQIFRPASAK